MTREIDQYQGAFLGAHQAEFAQLALDLKQKAKYRLPVPTIGPWLITVRRSNLRARQFGNS